MRTHIPRLHLINHHQPPREKTIITLSPHGVLLSVVVLAAVCNSVVSMRACCHRLPIYVPDHHHAASLLFGQRYRDCFWCVCYRSHSKLCVQQMYYYDGILLLLLQEAAAAQQLWLRRPRLSHTQQTVAHRSQLYPR